jgi:LysM repeat protein
MKNLVFTFLMILSLGMTSCSLFKKNPKGGSSSAEMNGEEMVSDEFEELAGEEIVLDNSMDEEISADIQMESSPQQMAAAPSMTSDMGTYTVQSNDTLMMIAFKLYGDYGYWKQLKSWNGLRGTSLTAGQSLKYKMPERAFSWNPSGTPYLIKRGDSLSLISKSVYGTWRHWGKIYQNNQPMIKRPNLIFAGFTLYYPDKSSFVASR